MNGETGLVKYGEHAAIPADASCQVCGNQEGNLITEHCHEHGWVRGITCRRCNRKMAQIDRRIMPRTEILDALLAHAARCPGCLPLGAAELALTGSLQSGRPVKYVKDEPPRTTVVLIPRTQEALDQTAGRMRITKTDVINRALVAYDYLERQAAAGAKVLVRRGDATEELRFL